MRLYTTLAIFVLLCSCTGYQYVSSPQYVPLNERKGELKASLSPNSFQVGYSIANNTSIFTTGYYRYRATSINLETMVGKENSGEYDRTDKLYDINLGVSLFKKKNALIYELLLGSGFGHINYESVIDLTSDYKFKMNASTFNAFAQPNIGIKIKNILEVGVFSRFNYIKYFDLKTTNILGSNQSIEPEDAYFIGKKNANLFFLEPGLSAKVGFKNIKFCAQVSPSINLTGSDIRYREFNIYLSIFLSIYPVDKKE